MKKLIIHVIFVLFYLGLSGNVSAKETLNIYAPASIWAQQQDDKLIGPIVDLLEHIFFEKNITIHSKKLPWARAMAQMKSGELDLVPVIFYTDERAQFMDYTIPYVEVPTSVFVPNGKVFLFKKIKDLKGRNGIMIRGDSISKEFEAYRSQLSLLEVEGYKPLFKMLEANRADYAVAAQYGFMIQAKKLGYETMFEKLTKPIASRHLHLAVSKKSGFVKYLPEMNRKLMELKSNGYIQKMIESAIQKAANR